MGEADRLRQFVERSGLQQKQLAHDCGFRTPGAVSQYLTGHRKLGLQMACKFARALRVDLRDISPRLAGELEGLVEAAHPGGAVGMEDEYVQVPYVQVSLRTGARQFSGSPLPGLPAHIAFRRDWLAERGYPASDVVAIRAPDDSMKPTINEADLVVLNAKSARPEEGQVFAVNYEGRLLLRRTFRDLGQWWLTCDYQDPQRYPRKQHAERNPLLGKVVHRQSEYV